MLTSLYGFSQWKQVSTLTNADTTDSQLVVFSEAPTDTFALIPIWRIKEANKMFVYLKQVTEEKDTLLVLINAQKALDITRQKMIEEQAARILKLTLEYQKGDFLLLQSELIIKNQKKKIKKLNWTIGGTAGVAGGLLLVAIMLGLK